MTTKEMILKQKGLWLVKLEDKSQWVLDLDNMMFDNLNWYQVMGTLESELIDIDNFFKKGSWKKYKEA